MSHTLRSGDTFVRHGRYVTEIHNGRCIQKLRRRPKPFKPSQQVSPMAIVINPHKAPPPVQSFPCFAALGGHWIGAVTAAVLSARCSITLDIMVIDTHTVRIGSHLYTRQSLAELRRVLAVAEGLMNGLNQYPEVAA
jgi:hypothetical protein